MINTTIIINNTSEDGKELDAYKATCKKSSHAIIEEVMKIMRIMGYTAKEVNETILDIAYEIEVRTEEDAEDPMDVNDADDWIWENE